MKNFYYSILEYTIRIVASLFIMSIIASELGVVKFGEYSYQIALFTLLLTISKYGLDNYLTNKLILGKNKNSYINAAILYRFLFSILVSILSLFLIDDISNLVVVALFFYIFDVVYSLYQVNDEVGQYSKIKLFSFVLISCAKVFFIIKGVDVNKLLILLSLEGFTISVISIFYIKKELRFRVNKEVIMIMGGMIKESFPLFISNISIIVFMKTDQFIIKVILGNEYLGVYSFAIRIIESVFFIPMIITNIIFPRLLDRDNIDENISKLIASILLLVIPVVFFSLFFVFVLNKCYLTLGYENLTLIYSILLFSIIPIVFSTVIGRYLIFINKHKYEMYNSLISTFINAFLCYFLVSIFGVVGAAISTVIAYLLYGIVLFIFWGDLNIIRSIQVKVIGFLLKPMILKNFIKGLI